MDFILNGQAHGNVATALMASGFNTDTLRPFIGQDGRSYVNSGENAIPTVNATATLRKDEWKLLDDAVYRAAKPRLRVFGDLRTAGLTYNIPNGMAKTVLETETLSDIETASIDMDGLTQGQGDRPVSELSSMPLPIISKKFSFSARQVLTSRNGNTPLDTTTAELASRRVAEEVEKLTLGLSTFTYGGGSVQGYTNLTGRNTKTITLPTAGGWTPGVTVREIMAMKVQSQGDYHFGPWFCYCGPSWDNYMDDDYSAAKGDVTLRQRIGMIQGIDEPMTADYLTGYELLLVQKSSEVTRAIIGQEITLVQWETMGGMQLNYMVLAILVPQVRKDISGNCGIVHGS